MSEPIVRNALIDCVEDTLDAAKCRFRKCEMMTMRSNKVRSLARVNARGCKVLHQHEAHYDGEDDKLMMLYKHQK